jgi:peptidoglycan/xylan/chitin deacetylase (PgdA/CDA1 family)
MKKISNILKEIVIRTFLGIDYISGKKVGIPALLYHRVLESDIESPVACVTKEMFKKQMKYLKNSGYHSISIEELVSYLKTGKGSCEKAVIITFDDGFEDNYDAIKIAGQYGFTAVLFVSTGFCGKEYDHIPYIGEKTEEEFERSIKQNVYPRISYLGIQELQALSAIGTEVYPHTVHHRQLASASFADQKLEILEAHNFLKSNIQQDFDCFAYPYGMYNENTIECLKEIGYKCAFQVSDGLNKVGDDLFRLKRHNVGNTQSMAYFKLLLTNQYYYYKKAASLFRRRENDNTKRSLAP